MGETARERYQRERQQQAGSGTGVAQARPPRAPLQEPEYVVQPATVQGLLRRVLLVERMSRLGAPVALAELPHEAKDLDDLERACAEAEKAGK